MDWNNTQFEEIRTEFDKGILILELHRPDNMNAFTGKMNREMRSVLKDATTDDDVKVLIFTGHGERAYCAGADLASGADTFNYEARQKAGTVADIDKEQVTRDGGGLLTLDIFEFPKPVICACNGVAVGIGITMQLAMDIRLAADHARYGFVFARRGITPEAASGWFLPRIVGISKALEWCYSGRVFDASEALKHNLVSEVVPAANLLDRAKEIANEIIDNAAPVSIALTRHMMWRMMGADHPMEAHKIDSRAIKARGKQADAREGIESFLEKRPAKFPDKVSKDMPDFYPWWDQREFS